MAEAYGLETTRVEPLTAAPTLVAEEAVPDDWEELVDKRALSEATRPANLVKGVKYDATEVDITVKLPHGHAVLAGTRLWADSKLRCEALTTALNRARAGLKVAVVDVGSGASGVKQAVRLRQEVCEADTVYHHCMMPIACDADLIRLRALGRDADEVHWVSHDAPPVLSKVNVCMHKASECTCLALYDVRIPFTVHSHYYFTTRDWHNLFRYTDRVRTFGHYPRFAGQRVPELQPEAVWRPAIASVTVGGPAKRHARFRAMILQRDEMVAFEPCKTHGTTYYHVDPSIEVCAGGFHMPSSAVRRAAEAALNDATKTFILFALRTAGLATFWSTTVPSLLTFNWRRALWSGLLSVSAALPAAVAAYVYNAKHDQRPPLGTEYTVTVANVTSLTVAGEEIGHFFDYIKNPVCNLEPRTLESTIPDPKLARELASTMLLSKKSDAEKRAVIVARCFRDGMGPTAAAATVEAAAHYADLVMPKNEDAPPPIPLLSPATQAQLCALGVLGWTVIPQAAKLWNYTRTLICPIAEALQRSVNASAVVNSMLTGTSPPDALAIVPSNNTASAAAAEHTSSDGPLLMVLSWAHVLLMR